MRIEVKKRTEVMELQYQNIIERSPVEPKQLYAQACSADSTTLESWQETWLKNIRANKEKYGSFKDNSLKEIFGIFKHKSIIVAGSGPSLAYNSHLLKEKNGIPLISCLHNFHFFEDQDIEVDFYVSLDAGEITIEEVSEGGKNTPEFYWERSKSKTLLCYIGTSPRLLEKWQGRVLFFNAPIPGQAFEAEIEKIEPFNVFVSNGGNVLGASFYIAKGFLGCSTTAFIGADFCFSYGNKFHGWESKYDKNLGNVLKTVDVFGNACRTWQSYFNFKCWFDYVAQKVPGLYINCTEGGIFGSYAEGNIMAVKQMELSAFINMTNMFLINEDQVKNPESAQKIILF